ncbi:MAG TPA: tRNA (N6-threonylcarbamoyladenosine(37)-N6)-methyltransferase TrmO [Candidatus Thermoplasmatota archaeon]|nr:tRNA (N6-threonylcarbamoyladenosine(37)-N6)-methyltransferase TrmO [Candidatus Thermoplasmatota archaeon]
MDEIRLRPIGVVRSPYRTPLDAPRQGALAKETSTLHIDDAYAPGLEGVAAGRRLLVVWWAHEADRATLARPGTDGVFSMRTPHRPNPVCLTEVEVASIEGATLVVRGLDALDGTPILDIKSAEAEHEGWSALPRGPL